MRILFVIQGEGRGHLTQALSLANLLRENGHQIIGVSVGKSKSRQIPQFFTSKIGCDVKYFDSPNFLPNPTNRQSNLLRSVGYNLLRLNKYLSSILFLRKWINRADADLVINFYDLIAGLSYMICPPSTRMICIAHQYLFLHSDFQLLNQKRTQIWWLNFFSRLTSLGCEKRLALSFSRMYHDPYNKIQVVPPLLRNQVLQMPTRKGDYLHGYILNSGFGSEIERWHQLNPHTPLHFFWDKPQMPPQFSIDPTLTFHQIDDVKFLQYMASSKGYATTAGFESVCEAMYLQKPVLMVPTHIEQFCNAYDAQRAGAGICAQSFQLDQLLEAIDNYQPNLQFRHWAQQANSIILSQLTAPAPVSMPFTQPMPI